MCVCVCRSDVVAKDKTWQRVNDLDYIINNLVVIWLRYNANIGHAIFHISVSPESY